MAALRILLAEHPGLAIAKRCERTADDAECGWALLHVITDWPGHFPDGAASVAALVEAGADVNAGLMVSTARHRSFMEWDSRGTSLYWAASCYDVAVLDVLLDTGADIDAPGAVIGGGTPLSDATAFAQWYAAFRLVERRRPPPCSSLPPSGCRTAWPPTSPRHPTVAGRGQRRVLGAPVAVVAYAPPGIWRRRGPR